MRKNRLNVLTIAVGLSIFLTTSPGSAQNQGSDQHDGGGAREAAARAAFDEATRHYEAGRWMLAAHGFHRAWELLENSPNRTLVLFNEARALEQAPGQECEAKARYEQFLHEADGNMPDVQERLRTVQDRVRELDARLEGRSCDSGARDASPGNDGGISPAGPIVLSVGGATVVAGIITGAFALVQGNELRDACGGAVCPSSEANRASDVELMSGITDGLLFGGAAVAAVGIVLLLLLHEQPSQGSSVAFACGPTGCTVQGEF